MIRNGIDPRGLSFPFPSVSWLLYGTSRAAHTEEMPTSVPARIRRRRRPGTNVNNTTKSKESSEKTGWDPESVRISALGDHCAVVDLGGGISVDTNNRVLSLQSILLGDPFPGLRECIPAYSSLSVFYHPLVVREGGPGGRTAFAVVEGVIRDLLPLTDTNPPKEARTLEIPAVFDTTTGPDLEYVAKRAGLSVEEVVRTFVSRSYRVHMLGFLPGFPYMGSVDPCIATPRRPEPRKSVRKGSIGLAGEQTGIYPVNSPGGWQIIGRTETQLFDATSIPPALLKPGDEVRFVDKKKRKRP